jgi:hypothetical protein
MLALTDLQRETRVAEEALASKHRDQERLRIQTAAADTALLNLQQCVAPFGSFQRGFSCCCSGLRPGLM